MDKVEADIDYDEIAPQNVGSLRLEDVESHPFRSSNITKYTPYNQKVRSPIFVNFIPLVSPALNICRSWGRTTNRDPHTMCLFFIIF